MADRYDVIIIGSGAGGGTLAHKLAPSGKNILILERGPFLPREKENWDTVAVVQHERYHTRELWYDKHGNAIHPGTGYWVGGNTKVYGAALFRLRERDFEEVPHKHGVSPAWPIDYAEFEPYYAQAERLHEVHGERGTDPTEPPASEPFPLSAVPHEPRIQEIDAGLRAKGYRPFPIPLGVRLREDRRTSLCIRCNTCDGFPCLVDAKNDSDTTCVRPALTHPNVSLVTEATALRLLTDAAGTSVTGVVADVQGTPEEFMADLVVVAGGAINSAVLLLRSANAAHPQGIGNANDLVGRYFMKHNNGALAAVGKKPNPTVFQKTLALTDFYWGDERFPYPLGSVQLLGKLNKDMLHGDPPPLTPEKVLQELAAHSVDWFLTTEDLPDPNNRVGLDGDRIVLDYTENNLEAYRELNERFVHALRQIDCAQQLIPCTAYLRKQIPLQGVAHQVGTCRFGTDPRGFGARPELPRPLCRQPLRGRRQLPPLERSRQSIADDHRQCASGRRSLAAALERTSRRSARLGRGRVRTARRSGPPVRLLLGVLAVAMMLAPAVASASPEVRAVGCIAITVADLDRSVAFYTRVLDFREASETELAGAPYEQLDGIFGLRVRVAYLALGDERIELQEYLVPKGRPFPEDSRGNDRWFQHIAIVTSDMDRAYARLRAERVRYASSEPQRLPDWNRNAAGIRAFYFRDPDGHYLELLEFPRDKGAAKWHVASGALFLEIDHTAIVVRDTNASLRFYRDLLGFRIAGQSENYGNEQEHLNGVFGAHLRITTMRAAAGPGIEFLEYLWPADGRSIPLDERPNDLLYWQTTLVVRDVAETAALLRRTGTLFISPAIVQLPQNPVSKAVVLRDPDAHAMELVEP